MTQKIFLIRHAEPVLPEKKIYLGQLDLPLSPRGIQQAEKLAKGLQNERLSQIFCSDLLRAEQTAQILALSQRLEISRCSELREINLGKWEGKSFDEIRTYYPEEYAHRGTNIVSYRPPGGESFADLKERVWPYINECLDRATGNIAIVSHRGVIQVILCSLANLPLDQLFTFPQNYACVNILEKEHSRLRVRITNYVYGEMQASENS
ncbi:MAG: alpha-ribazole phosphatase [Peptococcaceae bacterium]|jgi:alpha-ribazole phosphatase|nr:alpha-ribazole phosphatase [Peptococcaceae bacterium]